MNALSISGIQVIFLDWGGVLCEDPSQGFVNYCSSFFKIPASTLRPVLLKNLPDFMQGLTEFEFWKRIARELPISSPDFSLWQKALQQVYRPHQPMLDLAKQLNKLGYRLALLSNTEPPSKQFHLQQGYDFFEQRFFSCDLNLVKPDANLFQTAIQSMGAQPEQCLLVDDRAENIQGARNIGMHAYHYQPENHHHFAALWS